MRDPRSDSSLRWFPASLGTNLEELLGREVDVVTEDGPCRMRGRHILADVRLNTQAQILASDPELAEAVCRLVDTYALQEVCLFGSDAHGVAGPDNDYDPVVLPPDAEPPERRGDELAYQVLFDTGTAANVVVWGRTGFARRTRRTAEESTQGSRKGPGLGP